MSRRDESGGRRSVELLEGGFVSVAEAATFLRVSRPLVYKLMDAGELPFVLVTPTLRRIPKRAVADFLARRLRGEAPRS